VGRSVESKCLDCGKSFTASYGGGFTFHLLHCDKCGKEKSIGFDKIDQYKNDERVFEVYAGKCKCGGSYSFEAAPRCPKCRSVNIKKDGITIMYD